MDRNRKGAGTNSGESGAMNLEADYTECAYIHKDVIDDQSQSKLIGITILLYKSTASKKKKKKKKEAQVLDALRLGHTIFSIFQ